MSDNYVFNPDSTFLNGLAFGGDAGSAMVAPEVRQIVAQNRTLDAVKQLGQLQGAELVGQHLSHDLQRETNQQLQDLSGGMAEMADGMNGIASSISDGMARQNEMLADGFGQVGQQIENLAEGVQDGFQQMGLGLRTGFQAVVQGLAHVDERLGQRLMSGFSVISQRLQDHHEETQATLIGGFDFMSSTIRETGVGTISAIAESTKVQVAALYEATHAQMQAAQAAANQIAGAVVASTRLQVEAGQQNTAALLTALSDLRHDVRRPAANEATEHFLVGMNFLNHLDFDRAHEQFPKARERYGGHFPTLFAAGFCCYVLGRPNAAQDSFEAALSQTDDEPQRALRQHALAALYLGRLAFDDGDYRRAQTWFEQAFSDHPELWNALVEAAASVLLDPTRPDQAADALAVKREFNRLPTQLAYLHWYLLALLLANLAPEIAREAFRAGADGDYHAREQNRVEVIALLWRLHPRHVASLIALVQDEFPWLA